MSAAIAPSGEERADSIVVIGSGPAGAMAAYRLCELGMPVTLLESGTNEPKGLIVRVGGRNVYRLAPEMTRDTRHLSSGDPRTEWYKYMEPGGLTNQWTGAVPRFAPEDFSDGERLHPRYRWPLDYKELHRHYRAVERLLTITGPGWDAAQLPGGVVHQMRDLPADWRRVADVADRRGQALVPMPLADGPNFSVARRATAFNSYSNLIAPLRAKRSFTLKTGCRALRLEWSGRKRRVESVLYRDSRDGADRRLEGAAFVVACGALGSVKLLFDSACADFPDGIGNECGNLGRFLHDHPKEWWRMDFDRPISRMSPASYLTRRPFADSEPLMSTSWTIGLASASRRDKLRSLIPGRSSSVGVQVFGSMVPTEDHYVRPHRDLKDEFGLPQLDIKLSFPPESTAKVVEARGYFADVMAEAGYVGRIDEVDPQLVPGKAVHFGGTARMHASPQHGVVDAWSRVFGVANLVVADSSTFTTSSEKNPTLTAMALARRAVERLACDLRS